MSKKLELDPSKISLRGIVSSDLEITQKFCCGNGSMESFLSMEAYPLHINREASTTLVFYEDEFIAYFTLHRHQLKSEIQFEDIEKDVLSLDRLAVSTNFKGKGVGTYLINKVKEIAYMTNEMFIQTFAVFERWKWYQELGFNHVIDDEIDESKTGDGLVYMILELLDKKELENYLEI